MIIYAIASAGVDTHLSNFKIKSTSVLMKTHLLMPPSQMPARTRSFHGCFLQRGRIQRGRTFMASSPFPILSLSLSMSLSLYIIFFCTHTHTHTLSLSHTHTHTHIIYICCCCCFHCHITCINYMTVARSSVRFIS